jgi:hypothetical protein
MTGRRSALSALGLELGADADAIDRAYRALIKRHHPDREGGDAERAAEITRAYRELRGSAAPAALDFHGDGTPPGRESRWVGWAFLAGVAILAAVSLSGQLGRWRTTAPIPPPPAAAAGLPDASYDIDGPLDDAAIRHGVADALRAEARGEYALLAQSSACHADFRRNRSLAGLDRCAAFDRAVTLIQDRDPLRDRGPFSELTVTGRLTSAGTWLSNDFLAIEGRLHRVRVQVELLLAGRNASQRSVVVDEAPERAPSGAESADGSPPDKA